MTVSHHDFDLLSLLIKFDKFTLMPEIS